MPEDRILIENRSTNTGENVRFTRQLLAERDIDPASFILVQKPYMERRAYATFRKVWPEKPVQVTSPRVTFHDYLTRTRTRRSPRPMSSGSWSVTCSGSSCTPARGFQIAQEIPDDVWAAYQALVDAGFDAHLVA